ncbi:MAG: tetratricopeptide repeat protein [Cellvibrionaceae bacterium]
MSVVNKALDHFSEGEHGIDKQRIVVDLPFYEDSVEKEEGQSEFKASNRPYIIIALLFISVSIYTYDRMVISSVPLEAEEVVEPIDIETVLVNKPFEYSNEASKSQAPESIIDFIGSYNFIPDKVNEGKKEKVVIYEIIEKVDNSKKIAVFLKEAEIFLKTDKLTSPKGNNAFERYQMVLSLDEKNQQALEGINRIVNRYVTLAERVIKKNEAYKVAGLIKSAYFVGQDYMDMGPIVSKYASYLDDQNVFINVPSETIKHINERAEEKEMAAKVDDIMSIKRSISDVDSDIALTASKLIQENNIDAATVVLERFSSLSDYWGKSYDLLLNMYLKQSDVKKAEALISNNTTLDPFQMAEKVSRLFIAGEDPQGALNLLNGHFPDIKQYNEYYAVKAGLYHDTGRYDEAIDLYRKLIKEDYDNSRYWLGLAVSLDAKSDPNAVEAFRYAYEYSSPNSNVKEYIEQRLLVLAQ